MPKINIENFKCFWSVGTGWGELVFNNNEVALKVLYGYIDISKMKLPTLKREIKTIHKNEYGVSFDICNRDIMFEECLKIEIEETLVIKLNDQV